jgi:hypothetical protein
MSRTQTIFGCVIAVVALVYFVVPARFPVEKLNLIKPGMTKDQVRAVLGEPWRAEAITWYYKDGLLHDPVPIDFGDDGKVADPALRMPATISENRISD